MALDLSAQLAALRSRLNIVEARQISANPNDILFSAIGQTVLYGCKVTEGADDEDMTIALEGQATGDDEHWNPNYEASPLRPFQYANIAQGMDGAFRAGDLTAEVATAPATGLGRYDIAYIYVGPGGAGFAVASGTPSADVKTDFDTYGLDTAAYGAGTITDPDLPLGAFPIARIYVEDDVPGIPNSRIADLRTYFVLAGSIQNNFSGVGPPGINNDASQGYSQGSKWWDVSENPDEVYLCTDATIGAAVWQNITIGTEDLGSMAVQNANAVNISGGAITGTTINNCVIGGVTPAAATFTTATMTGITTLSAGTAANPSLTFTGATDKGLYDGGSNVVAMAARGLTAATFTNPASSVNYPTFSGSATGNGVEFGSAGSDSNIAHIYRTKGAGSHRFFIGTAEQFRIENVTTSVNMWSATGGTTGNTPAFYCIGSDTNIGGNFYTKGTGGFTFLTNSAAAVAQLALTHTASAVNYALITGAPTGDLVRFQAAGSDASIGIYIMPKGSGAMRVVATNGVNSLSVPVSTSNVNYWSMAGAATTAFPSLAAVGTDTNISSVYATKGTGSHFFQTNGTVNQLVVANTASAVNWAQISGGATGSSPYLWSRGTDTNISYGYSTKGTGEHVFSSHDFAHVQFKIVSPVSAVNFVQATGRATGAAPYFWARGTDTNIGLGFYTTGTGAIDFFTDGAGTAPRQVQISHTATSVNFWQISGSATTNGLTLFSSGSDTNISQVYITKGSGEFIVCTGGSSSFAQFRVSHTANAVNYVRATGSATGTAIAISAQGADSNVPLSIFSKGTSDLNLLSAGTGSVRIYSNAGTEQARFMHTASAVNYVAITGATTGNTPTIASAGSDSNVSITFVAKGSGSVYVQTNGGSGALTQALFVHTAAAVNYPQISGAATGQAPYLLASGSDTNVGLVLSSKGTGTIAMYSGQFTRLLLQLPNVASAVNYISVVGSATATKVQISAQGSDTDIDLGLIPKGAGVLDITGTAIVAAAVVSTHKLALKISGVTYYALLTNVP